MYYYYYFLEKDRMEKLYLTLSCSLLEFLAGEADAEDLWNAAYYVIENWPTKGGDAQGDMRTPSESEEED